VNKELMGIQEHVGHKDLKEIQELVLQDQMENQGPMVEMDLLVQKDLQGQEEM